MKSSKDIYSKLAEDLCGVESLDGDHMKALQNIFISKNNKCQRNVYLVTLDEIDHLLDVDIETLYTIFEWSLQPKSNLILLGIANALDLTDRFLPRLKARNLKPELLPFLPYTAPQIASVLTNRLKSLVPEDSSAAPDYVPFIHPTAILLCAKKVASQTGDLRRAFDIARRAIDLIENETKQKMQRKLDDQVLQASPTKSALVENMNLSSHTSPRKRVPQPTLASSLATLTFETAPRASIAHIAKIASAAFGNGTTQRLQTLNLQQKAALCSLVAMEKKKRARSLFSTPSKSVSQAPTIKMLFNTYSGLCTRDNVLQPLTATEFCDVIGSMETLGVITEVDGRNGMLKGIGTPSKKGRPAFAGRTTGEDRRLASCVAEKEVEACCEGVGAGILKSLLAGEGL